MFTCSPYVLSLEGVSWVTGQLDLSLLLNRTPYTDGTAGEGLAKAIGRHDENEARAPGRPCWGLRPPLEVESFVQACQACLRSRCCQSGRG